MNTNSAGARSSADKAADCKAGVAEIQQETQTHAGRAEIVHAPSAMDVMHGLERFQFNEYRLFDQHGDNVLTDDDPIVHHCETVLLSECEACDAQFVRPRVLVNAFSAPGTKCMRNNQGTANDPFGQLVRQTLIGVHRCSPVDQFACPPSHPKLAKAFTPPPSA
jgi:hypothetical protein